MTLEELEKVSFHFVSHINMGHEHISTFANECNNLGVCVHTIYKNGRPYRTYRHWRIGANIYKSKKKFLEAIKNIDTERVNP